MNVTIWDELTAIGTVGAVVLTLLALLYTKINKWWSLGVFSVSVADSLVARTFRDPQAELDNVVVGFNH